MEKKVLNLVAQFTCKFKAVQKLRKETRRMTFTSDAREFLGERTLTDEKASHTSDK